MKVVSLRDHINNYEAAIDDAGLPPHVDPAKRPARHVPQGTVFEFGPETVKEPKKLAPELRQQLALLVYAKCLGDAADEKLVARVRAEAQATAELEARHEAARQQAAQTSRAQLRVALGV